MKFGPDMPEDKLASYVDGMRAALASAVAAMPTHQQWIDRYWKVPAP